METRLSSNSTARTRVILDRPGLWLPLALALMVVPSTGCMEPASAPTPAGARSVAAADPCTVEPLSPFDAMQEGAPSSPSLSFSGQVVDIQPPDEFGRAHYRIRESSGVEHTLACQIQDQSLPVQTGRSYAFELERVGGFPPASALVIRDDAGLLFAGASDQGIGDHVLKGGLTGFELALLPVTCPSRPHDACLTGVFNRALQVTAADQARALQQGEAARLGGYDVRCLIAQRAEYSGSCPDYALVQVSYTIARAK